MNKSILESIRNITDGYYSYYNVKIAFAVVPHEIFNPISQAYRNNELTLKESCTLLNQKLSK